MTDMSAPDDDVFDENEPFMVRHGGDGRLVLIQQPDILDSLLSYPRVLALIGLNANPTHDQIEAWTRGQLATHYDSRLALALALRSWMRTIDPAWESEDGATPLDPDDPGWEAPFATAVDIDPNDPAWITVEVPDEPEPKLPPPRFFPHVQGYAVDDVGMHTPGHSEPRLRALSKAMLVHYEETT